MTGLWVFYDNTNDDQVQKLIIDGKRAELDPRFKERSAIEKGLVELMEQCWEHDPKKRPDIFTVILKLRIAEVPQHPIASGFSEYFLAFRLRKRTAS